MPTDSENKSNPKLPEENSSQHEPQPSELDKATPSQPTIRINPVQAADLEDETPEDHVWPATPATPAQPGAPQRPPAPEPTRRITYAEEPKPVSTPPQPTPAEPTRRIYVAPAEPTQRIHIKPQLPQSTQIISRPGEPRPQPAQSQPPSEPAGTPLPPPPPFDDRRPREATPPARPAYPQASPSPGWEPTQAVPPSQMPPSQMPPSQMPSPKASGRQQAQANAGRPTLQASPVQRPATGRPQPQVHGHGGFPPAQSPPGAPSETAQAEPKKRPRWPSILLTITLTTVGLFFIGVVVSVIAYVAIAAQLPSPGELRQREPDFASSQIYDRQGRLLHEIIDPSAGKRTYIPINQVSDYLKWATISTEDRTFYTHTGVEPIAVVRAIVYALQERRVVSGFSSITQQVARNILLTDEASERSASRKIKEVVLATELERRYSKDEILEVYLNNNNYGNLAYGIDAAARTYFGTSAANLTLSQAAFLAGIPQLPSVYDPYHGGRDAALKRHKVVLGLMVEAKYITQAEADAAAVEMEQYEFAPIFTDRIPAAHFVTYVKQSLEEQLGADQLYTGGGLRIHTTLDWDMQNIAEEEVANGVTGMANLNVTNGALVAIEPASGHILAMVGSVDFYNEEIGGQVNVALRCRQPGSAIKPLTYLAALEKGWTPATVLWDVPTVYTDAWGNRYEPVNYDGKFRGPASMRIALANSLNLPAVKALEFVTVDGLLSMSERLGATSIVSPQLECPDYPGDTRPYYGLALTLGGGELKLLELVSAYATFANNGMQQKPTPILWVEDSKGEILIDNRQPKGVEVVKPELAYLLTNILSDTQARCLVFACPNKLQLADRPVAAKTGTTNDNRDAWLVGYTPDIAAGVWVGNNDNSVMANVAGAGGAGPIWNAFMTRAHANITPHSFARPVGVVEREICTLSGTEPSEYCPEKRVEVFSANALPPKADQDWYRQIEIDGNSGLRANEHCRNNVVTKVMLDLSQITDPGGRKWMQEWAGQNGHEVAPDQYCTSSDGVPQVVITSPQSDAEVYGLVEIRGTVELPDFDRYEITYGVGRDPQAWGWVSGPHLAQVRDGLLGYWQIPLEWAPGTYTIHIVAYNKQGAQFEARVPVNLVGPTATPTMPATDTPTPTQTPPPTDIPTDTPTTEASPTPEIIPTDTPTPTFTPTIEISPTPSLTPTETLTPTVSSPG
ncbi:MAG: transglycosylase domain-containing protein [Anaerolineae bacterium]|nr:transglycosylase domain-containing protein [Anaerolineae bacterium]